MYKCQEESYIFVRKLKSELSMIGERLRQVRVLLKLTQVSICKDLNEIQANYSRYEKGIITPNITFLYNFCKKYSINLYWIVSGEGDMFLDKNENISHKFDKLETIDPEEWRKNKNLEFMKKIKEINDSPRNISYLSEEITNIPFTADFFDLPVSGDISAGYPIPIHSDDELRVIPVSRKLLSEPSGYYCFRVNGESMQPEIFHNDYVVISKEFVPEELHGRIVAVRNDEGITLKRMIIDFNNQISLLVPVNTSFSPILLDESHVIIGVIKLILRMYDYIN